MTWYRQPGLTVYSLRTINGDYWCLLIRRLLIFVKMVIIHVINYVCLP